MRKIGAGIKTYFQPRNTWEWLAKLAHLAGTIIVFFHLLPHSWTGNIILTIVFYGITLLLVIAQNFILFNRFEQKNIEYKLQNIEYERLFQKNKEEQIYVKAHKEINAVFSIIYKMNMNNQDSKENILRSASDVCTKLAQIFSDLKGCKCNVCIKYLRSTDSKKKEDIEVATLVRDTYFSNDRDLIDKNKNIKHILSNNDDFWILFKKIGTLEGRYFMSNSLPDREGYRNTSFLACGDNTSLTYFHSNTPYEYKIKHWPLKYFSTLVVPIIIDIDGVSPEDSLLGFICVDSKEMNIFNEDIDPEILIGCGEALYSSINNIIPKNEKAIENTQTQQNV